MSPFFMGETMTEEVKKERKPRKVEVDVVRKCSDEEGNEFMPGSVAKMNRELAQKFLDNGVVKARL